MEEDGSDKKMTRMKKMTRKKVWIPRWHFPWRDGGRCKWLKNDKSENKDEEKEAECLDETSPDDMEEDVSYINDNLHLPPSLPW